MRNCTTGQLNGIIHIKGLRQVFESTSLIGGNGAIEIGVGRHDDNRQVSIFVTDSVEEFEAVHPRHADIRDQRIGLLTPKLLQCRIGFFKTTHVHIGLFECLFQHPTN